MTLEQQIHAGDELPLSNDRIRRLIKRIEGGDSSALIALYDGTSRLVFGLIVRVLKDRTAAEETLLDVYTQVWKQSSFGPEVPALDWLIGIARESAAARLNWGQRDKTKREIPAESIDSAMTVSPERQELARSSLSSIPGLQKELLERAYYGGMSCAEMAAQIGKPLGAVKTHLRLGLSTLSDSIRQEAGPKMKAGTATGGDIEARKSD
jgi:RNA polymerase sigma-70 factor, ECF subfamily